MNHRKIGWLAGLMVLVLLFSGCGDAKSNAQQLPQSKMAQSAVNAPLRVPMTLPVPKPTHLALGPSDVPEHARGLYPDLMKMCLTDLIYENDPDLIARRAKGLDWPGRGHTMIGLKRLDNLHYCIEDVILRGVPGDFLEAGAWRGGACIFMSAMLREYGIKDRIVWVADSFEGMPPPDPTKYADDKGLNLNEYNELAVSLEEVKGNFDRYQLLSDQVRFLKGWFKDTLPTAPVKKLAILRLDGDMYESTMDTLVPLYPKVSSGGYIIVDDYVIIQAQRKAVDDYRKQHGITEEIKYVDTAGAYWQKR